MVCTLCKGELNFYRHSKKIESSCCRCILQEKFEMIVQLVNEIGEH